MLDLPSGERCAVAAIHYKGVELYRVASPGERSGRFDPLAALTLVENELTTWLVAAVLDRIRTDKGDEAAELVHDKLMKYEPYYQEEDEDIGL